MNYTLYKNTETDEEFEGLDVLNQFDTDEIIDWVNRYTFDKYQTYDEWIYDLSDEQLIDEANNREINVIDNVDFGDMFKELLAEVPAEQQTMHFKVMVDRITKDFINGK